ncbi:molybdenum cofactor guanylyltransferase [Paenibacillus crassostreae]|uniref:MobA-like NTP transferase domain-containing protein n=1 Tax=Paenibacillus crassostreae TaxID=1763538 RepID=A0A162RSP8_9BACL|nr:molybdenum cofactor guanylyltransferase [Paenibacillus crassostreae]AOZ91344.1 hypothetical protein LPB68_03410 [Paenibacillus crassostreae]OAB74497.1 hypothetical protein PNBC_10550 [Paenibacillus crassostreae]
MVTGVILAGGRNSRMQGFNKALLSLDGETFIERQVRVLRTLCDEIMIVTPDPSIYIDLMLGEIEYLSDVYVGHGPLSGIHASFSKIRTEFAWVVGCDHPSLSVTAAQLMLDYLRKNDFDSVIPVIGGKHQMLHGVYRPQSILNSVIQLIEAEKYRLSGLLDVMNWVGIDESEWIARGISTDFTKDVDTPEQYLAILED